MLLKFNFGFLQWWYKYGTELLRDFNCDFNINQPNRIAELYNCKKTHYTGGTIYPFLRFDDLDASLFQRVRTLIRNNNPTPGFHLMQTIAANSRSLEERFTNR